MRSHIHIFGGIDLSLWRITVLAGLMVCWALFLLRARRRGWPLQQMLLLLVLSLPVGTAGGHLFNVLIPLALGPGAAAPASGLTVIGSIVAVIGFAVPYIRYVLRTDPLRLLDAVAFTLPLSILVGRAGCLLNGCCYGKAAPDWTGGSLLSALTLRAGAYAPGSPAGLAFAGAPPDLPVWNLPLLLMLNALLVLATTEVLYRTRERWRLVPGTVIAAACTHYAAGRYFLEFLRKDLTVGSTPFNPWQLAVLALFGAAALWLGACLRRRGRPAAHISQEAPT